jgi:hypothetical protein
VCSGCAVFDASILRLERRRFDRPSNRAGRLSDPTLRRLRVVSLHLHFWGMRDASVIDVSQTAVSRKTGQVIEPYRRRRFEVQAASLRTL